jgi:uncharacterized repeat protein (TIGR02543 family)
VLTACDNGADAPREELARVRIGVVSDTQSVMNTRGVTDTRGVIDTRSVLPTAPALEDVERFALHGTASGKSPNAADYKESWLADFSYRDGGFYDNNDKPAVVYLRPGVWRFTLYAYQGEDAALKGTATATITAGFSGTVNFTLAPYSEEGGTGSVSIRLDLPEGSGVASVETTIDGGPLEQALAIAEGAVVYKNEEMSVGQYLFSFVLKDAAGKTILVVSDIVVVTSGAKSAKEYALTDTDFNGPPAAPSDFMVASYDAGNQTFHFTWQDNSFNETGFILSDGTTTHDIDAATQSFDFPVSDPTASATYTLKAVNSFGESAPAHINGPFPVTITFDVDNGDVEAQTLQTSLGGSIGADMPANPTKTNYAFGGWYTAKNGGGSAFTADTSITSGLTMFAKWINLYIVTFDADGGNPKAQTRTVIHDGTLGTNTPPTEPTKTNYAFGGWYTEKNGGGSAFTADTSITSGLTVFAKWINVYTVTFDADGGSPATQTRTVIDGGTLGTNTPPTELTKTNYTFGGWYTAKNGGGSVFTADTIITSNLTVYAKWTIVQYTVTFDLQGGDINGSTGQQTCMANSGAPLGVNMPPTEPTKTNYAFGGWYTASGGDGSAFTAGTIITSGLTVYAKWIDLYTVTFDADGGSPATQTRTVIDGRTLGTDTPTEPTKPNYAFGGWYTASGGGGSAFTADTIITSDLTVYTKWIDIYTVTFNADGGSPATQTRTVIDGGMLGTNTPTEPTKTNYAFGGWYTANGGGGSAFTAGTSITRNLTVYAKWINVYTVTFDADGGSPATQTRTVIDGGTLGTNTPANPTRTNYAFGGWYTAQNGGGSAFTAGTSITRNLTVYAKWINVYTVTLDAGGGSPATQTWTEIDGGTLGANMPANPTRTNYAFGGWYTAQNGGGSAFTAGTSITRNLTVYAKWIDVYPVTLNADGGSPAIQTWTVIDGGTLGTNMPANPTRTNYAFGGWYTAQNGGGSAFTADTSITSGLTVYAKWTIIQYTVTFDLQGGGINGATGQQTYTMNSGTSFGVTMPANPTRTNYNFDGWYTASNGGGNAFTADTIITGNMTIYAEWFEDGRYELTRDTASSNYICNTNDLLPSGFTVGEGEQITVSFSIRTDTALTGFYVGIGDWNNSASYGSGEDGWIAGWRNKKSVSADGQFHSYTWKMTAFGAAPAGNNPLVFHFAIDGVSKDKVIVYVKNVSVTKSPGLSSDLSLAQALEWVANNAEEGGAYTITLKNNESIAPKTLSYSGKNVSITLNGGTAERIVSLTSTGSLFTIGSGVTLTLGSNVTLQGRNSNSASLVRVNDGGALTMKNGSKVSGNTSSSSGGVDVSSNGTFTMSGGEISGNTASNFGGGVRVSGTFTLSGGEISGNTARYGGGVDVPSSGTFTLSGGAISGNTASTYGGGVDVSGGTFTLSGGEISGNSASASYAAGGGVYVSSSGTFTLSGGEISGNTAPQGGGVYVGDGTFTQNGGEISGNSASYGGGVYSGGTFTQSGGMISSNSTSSSGGGVYVDGMFIKQSGGIIYGSDASGTLKNTASNDYGHAVYVTGGKERDSTAGSSVTLNSGISGAAGGWE